MQTESNNITPTFISLSHQFHNVHSETLVPVSNGNTLGTAMDALLRSSQLQDMVYFYTQIDNLWVIYSGELNHENTSNSIGVVAAIEIAEGEYDYRVNLIHGFTYTHDINLATIFPINQHSLRKDSSEILVPVTQVSGQIKRIF
ncbi:hypothetical protein OM416_20565 [Paenibacillus sp. LS1]|uniref:hypothetical protein n=1 Tax=Paenibacillus sp. LS1 TaxID=2992120 RepID=UPI002230667F|nr:hypothetical protein [Paenibacillus sp. LS1]MCW3793992.1 hypothetical protein [Paenibacillus sp. LS1]